MTIKELLICDARQKLQIIVNLDKEDSCVMLLLNQSGIEGATPNSKVSEEYLWKHIAYMTKTIIVTRISFSRPTKNI